MDDKATPKIGTVSTTVGAKTADAIPLEFRMQLEEQERAKAEADGKSPKDVAWDQFIESEFVHHDFEMAKKHLDRFIGCRLKETKDIEEICRELFLGFTQGQNGIKKSSECADYVLTRVKGTRNIELLSEITAYYDTLHNPEKSESFYYRLYEIYAKGDGVAPDNEKAAKCLKSAIDGVNTSDRRQQLRELYAKQCREDSESKRAKFAYERAIEEKIPSAKTDYANYLMEQKQSKEAVHWFVADEEYKLAYDAVNIKKEKDIQQAVKDFHEASDNQGYKKSLELMKNRFGDLKTIMYAKEPASYAGILWRYLLFSILYALYHTFCLSQVAFIGALIVAVVVPLVMSMALGWPEDYAPAIISISLLVWTISVFCVDLWRRYKFSKAKELWKMLVPHPQLESRKELFDEEIIKQKRSSVKLAFISGIVIAVVLGLGIQYIVGSGAQKSLPFFTQHEAEKANEKDQSTASQKVEKQDRESLTSKTEDIKQKPSTEKKGKVEYKIFSGDNGIAFEYPSNAVKIEQEKKDASFTTYHIEVSEYIHLWTGIENTSLKSPDEVQKNIWEHVKNINKMCESSGTKCSIETVNDTTVILRWEYVQKSTSIRFSHEAKYRYVNNGGKYQRQFIETAFAESKIADSDKETIQRIFNSFRVK